MSYGSLVLAVACGSSGRPGAGARRSCRRSGSKRWGRSTGRGSCSPTASAPDGLIWTLSRDGVARIDGDEVVAEGPGEVQVVAEWEGERVAWTLRVELGDVARVRGPAVVAPGRASRCRWSSTAKVGDATVDIRRRRLGDVEPGGAHGDDEARPSGSGCGRGRLPHGAGARGLGDGRDRGRPVTRGVPTGPGCSSPASRRLRRPASRPGGPRGPSPPCGARPAPRPCGR